MKSTIVFAFLLATATISEIGLAQNHFVNGDFQLGNTGFYSDYPVGIASFSERHDVVTNPLDSFNNNPAILSLYDHTFGDESGLLLAVNGCNTCMQGDRVWSQTVPLAPNTTYRFSVWVASWTLQMPLGNLRFNTTVSGVDLGSTTAPDTANTWVQYSIDFNSGAGGTHDFWITDIERSWGGNDYAIDDIALTEIGGGPDSDGDGVPDSDDICPGFDDNSDTDGDLVPDGCDPCPNDSENDADGDGVCGDVDTCPGGDDNQNADGDALPDFCDVCPLDEQNDADDDGICEVDDNCEAVFNPDQADTDGDSFGDACDADIDNDGVLNGEDNCLFDANSDQADSDNDGAGDVCDDDIDGDGVVDAQDACVPTPVGEVVDESGCSIGELCPCDNDWKNHGAYVRCVAQTSEDFVDSGLISETDKDTVVSAAGQSECGHKN